MTMAEKVIEICKNQEAYNAMLTLVTAPDKKFSNEEIVDMVYETFNRK